MLRSQGDDHLMYTSDSGVHMGRWLYSCPANRTPFEQLTMVKHRLIYNSMLVLSSRRVKL